MRAPPTAASWEPAREIHDGGFGTQTVGNLIAVLPDGTLLNLFTEINFDSAQPDGAFLRVIRSSDQGATWSGSVTVAEMLTVGTVNPETGAAVRTGGILGSIAVGPGPQDVWAAWQDSRYSTSPGVPRDGVVLGHSSDGGLTWDEPVLVSPDNTQAFTPTVHVAAGGIVGVTYYDLRDEVFGDGYALTGYWLATTTDGEAFDERRVSGPFDLGIAPNARGLFLGDYEGLASDGINFVPFFAQTRPSLADRTNIYTVSLPTIDLAKAAAPTRRARTVRAAAMTPEWAERVQANIERSRKHFPDRTKPAFPPGYLR